MLLTILNILSTMYTTKFKFILLITILFFGVTAKSQERINVIKTNVVGAFVGQYQLTYERAFLPSLSGQFSLGAISTGSEGTSSVDGQSYSYETQKSGIIIVPELRWYPGKFAPEGFFIAAYGRLRNINKDLTDHSNGASGIDQNLSREESVLTYGGGGTLGFQWISRGGFSFDIFLGAGYKSRSSKMKYDLTHLNDKSSDENYSTVGDQLFSKKYLDFKLEDTEGVSPRFGFNFGYAF